MLLKDVYDTSSTPAWWCQHGRVSGQFDKHQYYTMQYALLQFSYRLQQWWVIDYDVWCADIDRT